VNEEKRKFLRFEYSLSAELVKLEEKNKLIKKIKAHDFSSEGLKLDIYLNLNTGSNIELKLLIPEKNLSTSLLGEIVWSKYIGDKVEVGIKIKEMDKKIKSEILSWVFPKWLEKERGQKEKQKK